ncbi:Lrp/AsnC family transcriptional regulator [Streptomyces sp. BI20]|uniref:Lrp/AsnC family transcriptional regulator n=1 Tax=Streptomyces sp. BI20 TaxID=3403460 RepID=UPI003C713412
MDRDGTLNGPAPDAVDHAVLRALHRDPRASFAEVAAAAGVHERTVARRLERLVEGGRVRFLAQLVPEYLGEGLTVEVAVRCAPGRVHETAMALTRRPEVRSVEVATGAPEVFVEATVADEEGLFALADGVVGRLPGVVDLRTMIVLRLLLTANDWAPYDERPTPVRRAVATGVGLPAPISVDALDRELVALLARDARMSTSVLARELRVGESTARRRLARLRASHVLHLRLYADPALLGHPLEARFRLTVAPRGLEATIRALAAEPSVRHLVVVTGERALLGYSSHRDPAGFTEFTGGVLAGLEHVVSADTALLLRTYKRAWEPVGRAAPGGARVS